MTCKVFCQTDIEQEITGVPETGYNPFFFPSDGAQLLFSFTEESFTRVLSALQIGAYIAYGSEGRQVLWDFLVNVEYPMPFCAALIDCITNDEDTRNALSEWLASDPNAQKTIQDIVSKGSPITGGGTGILTADNDDALFGACTYLVDTMHDAIVDFNQLAEVGTNTRERANIILQAIPGFGDAMAAIPEYVDEVFADVIEVFEAQYTTTPITGSRDRLRCGLFCLAKANDRTLSWDLIQGYFWNLVSFESTIPNLALDFVGFLVTGSWAGQDVVNISFAQMATAMSVGNKFGTQIFPNLTTVMKLGLNDPDGDWETLCEDCVEPPTDLWQIVSCIGSVEKLSGPTSGVGTYEFRFTSENTGVGTNNFGYFAWENTAQQFVCTAFHSDVTPGAGVGTGYHFPPGSEATCEDQSGITEGFPIADSTTHYGGVGMATFYAYPFIITMTIVVSAI